MSPRVSFVVPCYNLGHLLSECIDSILGQTFGDFEILIMDDCSPDNTPAVAQSYRDPRVRYIRNESNLGHLRNYNKGLLLSRGEYVWLISADDLLRREYAIERYVQLMDGNPSVGYVFCPAVRLEGTQEAGVINTPYGMRDTIFSGERLFRQLIHANTIVAPTGMVRRRCYEEISLFPLDMPWGGDWYLWCLFALHFDAAYIADPMVCYRRHRGSMTTILMDGNVSQCATEDISMPWIMKRIVESHGRAYLRTACLQAAAREYARCIGSYRYRTTTARMTFDDFETSPCAQTLDKDERRSVRAQVYEGVGDWLRWAGDRDSAHALYFKAIREYRFAPTALLKWLLFGPGDWQRRCVHMLNKVRYAVR